jgi:uncharacterized protein (TIGR03067 family)
LAFSAAIWATVLEARAAEAAVPNALIQSTVQTASAITVGTTAGAVAPTVSVLSEEYLRAAARARLLRITAGALGAILIAVVVLLPRFAIRTPVAASLPDQQRLAGVWGVREVANAGQRFPNAGMKLTFAGDQCTMTFNNFSITARYELSASRTPKQITLSRDPDIRWPGIYEVEGDQLKICLDQGEKPERPTEFTTPTKPGVFLYVMERSRTP